MCNEQRSRAGTRRERGRITVAALALALCVWPWASACEDDVTPGSPDADSGGDTDGGGDVAPDVEPDADAGGEEFSIGALPGWDGPEDAYDTTTELEAQYREMRVESKDFDSGTIAVEENVPFSCARTRHDVLTHHDEILNLGGDDSRIRPGLLLQGARFREGVLATIPLQRSPITLSISLPVENPTVVVETPNTATIQEGVATLQRELGSVPGELPAMVSFQQSSVESIQELSLQVGAHASYDGLLTEFDLDAYFESSSTQRQFTVVAKLLQPMYTISFADDMLPNAESFFADTVSQDDWDDQVALGNVGPENLPVFVSSVTYGRIVVYSATSYYAASATDIEAALRLSYGNYRGEAGFDTSIQRFVQSMDIKVMALGGPTAAVTGAIVSGDYTALFGDADPTTAVPLTYVVRSIGGSRPVARIGSATSFVKEQCTQIPPTAGWFEVPIAGEETSTGFDHVSVNAHGEAWAVGDGGVYRCTACTQRDKPWTWKFEIDLPMDMSQVAVDDDGKILGIDRHWDEGGRLWCRGCAEPGLWDQHSIFYFEGTSFEPYWTSVDVAGSIDDPDGHYRFIDWGNGVLWGERDWESGIDSVMPLSYGFHQVSAADGDTFWLVGSPAGGHSTVSDYHVYRAEAGSTSLAVMSVPQAGDAGDPYIEVVAAATPGQVWALEKDTATILAWDGSAADAHGHPGGWVTATILAPEDEDPPVDDPIFLEAGPGTDLWIITTTGTIHRYLPE